MGEKMLGGSKKNKKEEGWSVWEEQEATFIEQEGFR